MKNVTFYASFLTMCSLLLISCTKSEQFNPQLEATASTTAGQPSYPPTLINNDHKFFQAIDTICPPYLQFTNKLDISKLIPGDYTQLTDGKLTIDITQGLGHVTKRNSTTTGWWKDWNVPPYVESNSPEILSLGNIRAIRLKLSKKCYVFGFELGSLIGTSNPLPDYTVQQDFRAYYINQNVTPDPVIGILTREIRYPEGATLIAIKSDIPFDEVIISYGSGAVGTVVEYAITNIRYVSDQQIFKAHKAD